MSENSLIGAMSVYKQNVYSTVMMLVLAFLLRIIRSNID